MIRTSLPIFIAILLSWPAACTSKGGPNNLGAAGGIPAADTDGGLGDSALSEGGTTGAGGGLSGGQPDGGGYKGEVSTDSPISRGGMSGSVDGSAGAGGSTGTTLVCSGTALTRQDTCSAVAPCEGKLDGSWLVGGGCLQGDGIAGSIKAALVVMEAAVGVCPTPGAAQVTATTKASGKFSFAGGNMTEHATLCTVGTVKIPSTCRVNCRNVIGSALKSNSLIQDVACDQTDSPCTCTLTGTMTVDRSVAYEANGGVLTVQGASGPEQEPSCAQISTLKLEQLLAGDVSLGTRVMWSLSRDPCTIVGLQFASSPSFVSFGTSAVLKVIPVLQDATRCAAHPADGSALEVTLTDPDRTGTSLGAATATFVNGVAEVAVQGGVHDGSVSVAVRLGDLASASLTLDVTPYLSLLPLNGVHRATLANGIVYAIKSTNCSFLTADATHPATPLILSSEVVLTSQCQPEEVDLLGTTAYVIRNGVLHRLDVAAPDKPQDLKWVSLPMQVHALAVRGGLAYAAASRTLVSGKPGGLLVLDVSAPSAPVARGSAEVLANPGEMLVVQGTVAYVQHSFSGGAAFDKSIAAFDITNPDAPKLAAADVVHGAFSEIASTDGYLFTLKDQLDVYSTANPLAPTLVGTLAVSGYHLIVSGNRLIFLSPDRTNSTATVVIVDISDPTHPTVRATPRIPGATYSGMIAMGISGDILYVVDFNAGIRFLNIAYYR